MYGHLPENPEEAIRTLMGDEPDAPSDCHRHCSHWDTEGECCECGDVRTPNPTYRKPEEWMPIDEEESL
jgi:hypothetical protein